MENDKRKQPYYTDITQGNYLCNHNTPTLITGRILPLLQWAVSNMLKISPSYKSKSSPAYIHTYIHTYIKQTRSEKIPKWVFPYLKRPNRNHNHYYWDNSTTTTTSTIGTTTIRINYNYTDTKYIHPPLLMRLTCKVFWIFQSYIFLVVVVMVFHRSLLVITFIAVIANGCQHVAAG